MSKTAFSDSFFHIVHTSINYMKKQELINLQRLSAAIGLFIRYWGFRKIHGEIWSVVYLSPKALSGVEIGKTLKVSKALVSRALKELEAEGLIFQTESENSKTKRYAAEEDVAKIIQGV
jgi:DNA-binding transcriptional regulator GbsR (MarR family)